MSSEEPAKESIGKQKPGTRRSEGLQQMEETPEKSSAEQLGNEALAFIEHLTERYGDNFEIGETMLIAEVLVDQEGEEFSCVEFAASDPRRYVQVGFLTAALRAAERTLDAEDLAPED